MRFGVIEKSCENRESISILHWDAVDWDSLLEERLVMRPLIHGRPTISSQFTANCRKYLALSRLFSEPVFARVL
jgi:hypothetical protein